MADGGSPTRTPSRTRSRAPISGDPSSARAASFMPHPSLERRRLASLQALDVLDTPPEDVFDGLARAAAAACAAPIAAVCLVDGRRTVFNPRYELQPRPGE